MPAITFYKHEPIPMEMHKVKIVQQLHLLPTEQRLQKMQEAGFNTFQLHNKDIFLDMLTDSGVNAMSDRQQAAMLTADDAYAGSETFYKMQAKLQELFGIENCLPAHQGRACENILATRFVKPGNCVIMNYHFTTAKAHITRLGGRVEELVKKEGLESRSDLPFKGDIDLDALAACIQRETPENIPFVRLEAGTNLIGGQPISYANMKAAMGCLFLILSNIHQSQLSAREMPPSIPQASGISLIRIPLISILFSPVISASLSLSAVMMAFFACWVRSGIVVQSMRTMGAVLRTFSGSIS